MDRVYAKWKSTENLYKILSKYDFQDKTSVKDDLKCSICQRILINSCQTQCGCRFCNKCISKHIEQGNSFCPRNGDLCKEHVLSSSADFSTDHRTNVEISRLVVKCPIGQCQHECQLNVMKDHLRLCNKMYEKCLFYQYGCQHVLMNDKSKTDHFLSDIYNHNKLLIDVMGNLKNEIVRLIDINKENKSEIELLNEKIKRFEHKFDDMNGQMKTMKVHNEQLVERLSLQLEEKIDRTSCELNAQIMEISQISKYEPENEKRSSRENPVEVGELVTGSGQILWDIDKFSEKERKGRWAKSEYFSINDNRYKLRLTLWANGYGDFIGTNVSVFLLVYPSLNDEYLVWPFKAQVVMNITNAACPTACKTISGQVVIDKPCYNSFNCSDPFNFLKSQLIEANLLRNNNFSLQCVVTIQ